MNKTYRDISIIGNCYRQQCHTPESGRPGCRPPPWEHYEGGRRLPGGGPIRAVGISTLCGVLAYAAIVCAPFRAATAMMPVTVNNPMTADLQGAGYTVQGVGTLAATNIGANELSAASLVTCDPWVDARAFGTNYSSSTISAALAEIGSSEATLLLAPGIWDISGSLTIPYNITLKFLRGAVLDIDSGQTVTINGNIEAGLYRIFADADADGDGVVFGGAVAQSAPVTWWGAKPSATAAANDVAFQQAINCLDATGVPLHVPAGTYQLSATLNHKRVDIYGDSIWSSWLHNSAARCIQADPVSPASGVYVRDIRLWGSQFGYHSNGKTQERLLFEKVFFIGTSSDTNMPPANGYGVYCDSAWVGCKLTQCVIDAMGWFSGDGMQNNLIEMCRFNANGVPVAGGGHVLYIGESNPNAAHTFVVRDCNIEMGSIKVEKLSNVVIEDTSIFDPYLQGNNGIVVGNCESIRLSNIMAEDTYIQYTGTVSRSFVDTVYCFKFDSHRQPSLFAWNLTTQIDQALDSALNDSSIMLHEGELYGRAFMKRSVSIYMPADTSATQTWSRVLHTTPRKSWISAVRMVAEEDIAGTNMNYATLNFYTHNKAGLWGWYAFTDGNDMTTFVPKTLPLVYGYAYNLEDNSLVIEKVNRGSGTLLPAMTITVEYYDQGVL